MRRCEEKLKYMQESRVSRLGLAADSRLASRQLQAREMHIGELKGRASCRTTRQKSQAGQAVISRLELATQTSREAKPPNHPVWEKLTLRIPFSPHYI